MTAAKAGPVAEFMTPGSGTEAGIQAVLAGSPFAGKVLGKIAPRIMAEYPAVARWLTRGARVGLGTAGGAIGGGLSGEGSGQGAATGAGATAFGEVVATPLQWMTRSMAGPMMQRLDAQRLSKVASEIAPNLPAAKTPAELHKLVMGTSGEALLGQALQGELKPVLQATGDKVFQFSALDTIKGGRMSPVTFEGALEELRKVGARGYSMTGDPRGAISAIEARQLRHELRQQMTDALKNPAKYLVQRGAGVYAKDLPPPIPGNDRIAASFDAAMKKYSRGREVVDVLSDPRVWEGGRLNMRNLQEIVSTEEYKSIGRTLGRDAQRFYGAVYRGGTALTRDKPGQLGLHARLYPGAGMPHLGVSLPRVPAYSGPETPSLAQKGASLAPAMSFAALGITGEGDAEPPTVPTKQESAAGSEPTSYEPDQLSDAERAFNAIRGIPNPIRGMALGVMPSVGRFQAGDIVQGASKTLGTVQRVLSNGAVVVKWRDGLVSTVKNAANVLRRRGQSL